jgi:hypothetical protein
MAIAQQGRTWTFTAVNEGVSFPGDLRELLGITFQGSGLTGGQRLVMRDSGVPGQGNILVDAVVATAPTSTADTGNLYHAQRPCFVKGIAIDNNALAGTWVVTVAFAV